MLNTTFEIRGYPDVKFSLETSTIITFKYTGLLQSPLASALGLLTFLAVTLVVITKLPTRLLW